VLQLIIFDVLMVFDVQSKLKYRILCNNKPGFFGIRWKGGGDYSAASIDTLQGIKVITFSFGIYSGNPINYSIQSKGRFIALPGVISGFCAKFNEALRIVTSQSFRFL